MSIEKCLWAISIFSQESRAGLVELRLDEKQKIVISPNEARDFALSILEAAEAAESDDFLIHFMEDRIKITEFFSQMEVLRDFRAFRDHKKRSAPK